MSKKILIAFFSLLLAITCLTACSNSEKNVSETITKDGLVYAPYSYERNEYKLVGVLDEREELVLPSEIDGKAVVAIGRSALYKNENVKKLVLPESIISIDDYAFDGCVSLESVKLSSGIKEIGFSAFSGCVRLTEIELPLSLEILESNVFARCTSLEKIYVNPNLKSIGRDAFSECPSISEIFVSDIAAWCGISFTNIGSNPICNAEKLYVSGRLAGDLLIEGAESISPFAFFNFKGIENLTLGDGVVNIGESAFSGCKSIKSLVLSDSVKRINTSAFNTCTSLEYISVGSGVEYFAGLAFYNCYSLRVLDVADFSAWCKAFFYTEGTGSANPMIYAERLFSNGEEVTVLEIPEGVEKISTLAFIGFRGNKLILPSTLKYIEDTAFYMCVNLKGEDAVYFRGSEAERDILNQSIGNNNFSEGTKINVLQ